MDSTAPPPPASTSATEYIRAAVKHDMAFFFDCPTRVNLSTVTDDVANGHDDLSWFSVLHPSHEKIEIDDVKYIQNQMDNEDDNIDIVTSEPQIKTVVPIVSFTKKRPLSRIARKPPGRNADSSTIVPDKENISVCSNSLQSHSVSSIAKMKPNSSRCRSRGAAAPGGGEKVQVEPRRKSTGKCNKQDMLDLLKKHNEKFAPVSLYEPPRHSVRDIRKWERHSGRTWSQLRPDERGVVNEEISQMKKEKISPFCV